jgi:hypothetical protein
VELGLGHISEAWGGVFPVMERLIINGFNDNHDPNMLAKALDMSKLQQLYLSDVELGIVVPELVRQNVRLKVLRIDVRERPLESWSTINQELDPIYQPERQKESLKMIITKSNEVLEEIEIVGRWWLMFPPSDLTRYLPALTSLSLTSRNLNLSRRYYLAEDELIAVSLHLPKLLHLGYEVELETETVSAPQTPLDVC